jgi:hypothetical protein
MRYGHETNSEAAGNYGAAVFMTGMALVFAATGIGYLKAALFPRKKQQDIGDFFAEELSNVAKELLAKKAVTMPNGESIVQENLENPITFYVKKAYKPEVKLGDLIPETHLVVKTDSITEKDWSEMENVKFICRRKVVINGKSSLFEVGEFVGIQ